jgi:hypothetical protein
MERAMLLQYLGASLGFHFEGLKFQTMKQSYVIRSWLREDAQVIVALGMESQCSLVLQMPHGLLGLFDLSSVFMKDSQLDFEGYLQITLYSSATLNICVFSYSRPPIV